jgi:hypothetical protein
VNGGKQREEWVSMTLRLLIATATLMYAVGAPLVLPTPVATMMSAKLPY